MLQYKTTLYSSQYNRKWHKINYCANHHHLDFNKYTYKDGHKVFLGPSQYVVDLFKKEKEQHTVWAALQGKEELKSW